MLFPDAGKAKAKGKERARSWDRERDRREQELLTFGSELPKALEVLGQTFDVDSYNEHCRVAVIGVAGWSPGTYTSQPRLHLSRACRRTDLHFQGQ